MTPAEMTSPPPPTHTASHYLTDARTRPPLLTCDLRVTHELRRVGGGGQNAGHRDSAARRRPALEIRLDLSHGWV